MEVKNRAEVKPVEAKPAAEKPVAVHPPRVQESAARMRVTAGAMIIVWASETVVRIDAHSVQPLWSVMEVPRTSSATTERRFLRPGCVTEMRTATPVRMRRTAATNPSGQGIIRPVPFRGTSLFFPSCANSQIVVELHKIEC